MATEMGAVEADKASILLVLNSLHTRFAPENEAVEVLMYKSGRMSVRATRDLKAEELFLAPCIPKQSRVQERTEQPGAVIVTLRLLAATDGRALAPAYEPDAWPGDPSTWEKAVRLTPSAEAKALAEGSSSRGAAPGVVAAARSDPSRYNLDPLTPLE